MLIKNAKVFTKEYNFRKLNIRMREGMIEAVGEELTPLPGEDVLDASGLTAIPGLVDIHFHGAAGYDVCDATPEALKTIADYEASQGVTVLCPATMTLAEETLTAVMKNAKAFKEGPDGAPLAGLHLEGPFLAAEKAGAQDPAYLRAPDAEMLHRLQEASGGLIRIADIAPELPGAMDFIDACKDEVCISLAHTAADYETASEAFTRGARHVTHLYNAMPGLTHRAPGPIAAAADHGAEAEIIADGIHIHGSMVRLAFRIFGADKVILISDSMEATGLPDGEYSLGGQKVVKSGKKAVLKDREDVIAGSVTNLFECMKTAVLEMKIPLSDAVRAATENPARAIGMEAEYGSIAPGKRSGVLLLNEDMELVKVLR